MSTTIVDEYNNADTTTDDIPEGGDTVDNSHAKLSKKGEKNPILKDEALVEQPSDGRNPGSDEALDKILKGGRTRGAKPSGAYKVPGDDGLPGLEDGTSSTR